MDILTVKKYVAAGAAVALLGLQSLSGQTFVEKKDAFQRSYVQEATGDYIKAIASLKAVYEEDSYETNLRLGWLTYLSGNFTEAKAYYNRSINLMPFSIEARYGLIYPAAAMGNWSEVMVQYEKILETCPNNSYAMHRLGLIYYGREEYDRALKLFEKVVNLYPFDYDGLSMLAWTNFKLNNLREAKILFQKALLNTPNGTSAIEGLDLLK
ncbi:MAG: tetratricopeptide repeat protein [Bacteroidia bacterium]|nr:MAG: tetratricopeptide repeat protein [Bacteroidia bacterium]